MKACTIPLLGLSILWTACAFAQAVAPARIQWQKTYGGDSSDRSPCLARTADGGWILGAHSYSGISSNKSTPNFGEYDFWVLRLDSKGNRIWERNFGGDGLDLLWDIKETMDGGVVMVGGSESAESGNKTSPRMYSYSYSDFWVVRLDANGNKLWDKTFGGTSPDEARSVQLTSDEGFLVAGTSYSTTNGNKTTPSVGLADFWVVRLNSQGQKLWDRTYGGLHDDKLTATCKTSDEGLILAGHSNSGIGGDKTRASNGGYDLWFVRIDADGNKLWDRSFGGDADEADARVIQTRDGGFLAGASTSSGVSGNKSSPFYGGTGMHYGDYWLLRLDADGNMIWDSDFGGTWYEILSDILQTPDGAFIIAGSSASGANGNKTAPLLYRNDLWLVRLNDAGGRVWDQTYNGINYLAWPRLQLTSDGGVVMAASSHGDPGDPGTTDLMLFKLSADALTAPQLRFSLMVSQGNAFRFHLSGISNRTYVTEFSADLQAWSPFSTNQLTSGSAEVVDTEASVLKRFYRARMLD